MRKLARLWSPDLRQIDLDVNRTYRDHLMFRERYGLKQQALFHVLGAYSVYNAEIGELTSSFTAFPTKQRFFYKSSRLLPRNVTNRCYSSHVPQ
jgi:hypothetical protein